MEQRFPSPSSAQSRFQMLKEDGITWERLEVSARLKPQAWEQLPCAARLPRRRCLGAGMAAGCPCSTGPTWGVPSVPPPSSPRATTLIPSCYHAQPLVPPHSSPCLEASPRPRSHPSEARGLDVAHHGPLGTIPQGRRARHRPVCHHGGPHAAFPAPPPALPRAPRWPRLRRGPIDFGMTKAWITKVRSASERKGRRLLASSS